MEYGSPPGTLDPLLADGFAPDRGLGRRHDTEDSDWDTLFVECDHVHVDVADNDMLFNGIEQECRPIGPALQPVLVAKGTKRCRDVHVQFSDEPPRVLLPDETSFDTRVVTDEQPYSNATCCGDLSKAHRFRRNTCIVIVLLVLGSLFGAWIWELISLRSNYAPEFPILYNGTALERKTGARFFRHVFPPEETETFELLGLSVHGGFEVYTFVSAFYIPRKHLETAKWRKMLESGHEVSCYNDIIAQNAHNLTMQMKLVRAANGSEISSFWSEGLDLYLKKILPGQSKRIQSLEHQFEEWFGASDLNKNDSVWIKWDHKKTFFYSEKRLIYPPIRNELGHAFFLSALMSRGRDLTSLLYVL
uniref:Uncharacterized protein n=1 Tax=Mucochytrium quahogii TaxID=96639 RepID=A0A7S2WFW3_9STRA|mmetsp:Transcript_15412/g.27113  ORF Transcript_15412/g.27113 Transcript_15412/m.27113 type:complete len:361 (-) Transcript_15412:244-1326(-)